MDINPQFLGATAQPAQAQQQFSAEPFMQIHEIIQALAQQYPQASEDFASILQALQMAVVRIRSQQGASEAAGPRIAG